MYSFRGLSTEADCLLVFPHILPTEPVAYASELCCVLAQKHLFPKISCSLFQIQCTTYTPHNLSFNLKVHQKM